MTTDIRTLTGDLTLLARFESDPKDLGDLSDQISQVSNAFTLAYLIGREADATFRRPMTDRNLHELEEVVHWPPSVGHLTYASPLSVEIVGASSTILIAFWMLRHPREVGAWLPTVVASWRDGWTDAQRQAADRRLQADTPQELSPSSTESPAIYKRVRLSSLERAAPGEDITTPMGNAIAHASLGARSVGKNVISAEILELPSVPPPPPGTGPE